jgi:hypothetical protein
LTESLDPQFLKEVVSTHFSPGEGAATSREQPPEWLPEVGVTGQELDAAVRRMCSKNTAPEPDGVPGKALGLALRVFGPRLKQLFDECLKLGKFPLDWKVARLVFLPKKDKPAESPSAYRPICLLNKADKLFERTLALESSPWER